MSDGVVRRNVDARVISYALAVASGDNMMKPEVRIVFQGCAAAALQAASGLVALAIACKTAANSPAVMRVFENSKDRDQFRTLLESLGASVDEAWVGDLKELFEVIVVLAAESAEDLEENRFRQWAQGLFLDTRPLAIGDASDVKADVEADEPAPDKRKRVRKPRSSKEVYEADRYENLVSKAVAMGVTSTRAVLGGGQVVIVGDSPRGERKLIKVRGSMTEAQNLCKQANDEIRKFHVGDAFP